MTMNSSTSQSTARNPSREANPADSARTVLPKARYGSQIQDSRERTPPILHRMATGTATEDDIYEALEEVIDPELGLDFVSLGLVYDVEVESDEAYITFTLTTPACPIGPQVSEQMREFVGQLQGISKVHPKMVFDPPWTPEMMSEDAKFALGY